jgi:hypothetical protein
VGPYKNKMCKCIRKLEYLFKKASRRVTSFFSSLFASLFVAVSFLFVIYLIPYGKEGWKFNWWIFAGLIFVYLVVYYPIGRKIIKNLNAKEISGYNKNFLVSFLTSVYITLIVISNFNRIATIIITIILLIISILIGLVIASKKDAIFNN